MFFFILRFDWTKCDGEVADSCFLSTQQFFGLLCWRNVDVSSFGQTNMDNELPERKPFLFFFLSLLRLHCHFTRHTCWIPEFPNRNRSIAGKKSIFIQVRGVFSSYNLKLHWGWLYELNDLLAEFKEVWILFCWFLVVFVDFE